MAYFLLSALLIGTLMAMMAVGVIFSRRELKGSCGGKGAADCLCDLEGRPRECERRGGKFGLPMHKDLA